MTNDAETLLGRGIYTVADASRLLHVPSARLRRWVRGYEQRVDGDRRWSEPVWQSELPVLARNSTALSFHDLVTARVVSGFAQRSVHWTVIRRLIVRAQEAFQTRSPLCSKRLVTDGRTIFLEVHGDVDDPLLIDLAQDQQAFHAVLRPYLTEVEFGSDRMARRWWPLGMDRAVVLDPERHFGQPVVATRGVPTNVLAAGLEAEGSVSTVADWYGVTETEVRDAVEFERGLGHRNAA